MNESFGLKGWVTIVVRDKDGNVKDKREVENMIVNSGKAAVVATIGGVESHIFKYLAIGSDGTAPAATQTALVAEVARKAGDVSLVTTNVANDTLQVVAIFSSSDGLTGNTTIEETGLFDAVTNGVMLNRTTFAPVNLNWDEGDSIQITWKVRAQ